MILFKFVYCKNNKNKTLHNIVSHDFRHAHRPAYKSRVWQVFVTNFQMSPPLSHIFLVLRLLTCIWGCHLCDLNIPKCCTCIIGILITQVYDIILITQVYDILFIMFCFMTVIHNSFGACREGVQTSHSTSRCLCPSQVSLGESD